MKKRRIASFLIAVACASVLLAARIIYYQIDRDLCWQCGHCYTACPQHAVVFDTLNGGLQIDPALCDGCGLCVQACPHGAIYQVTENDDDNTASVPAELSCYPNPMHTITCIHYKLPKHVHLAELTLYNIKGQPVCIRKLDKPSGSFFWTGTDKFGTRVPSGVYLANLIYQNNKLTMKIVKEH